MNVDPNAILLTTKKERFYFIKEEENESNFD
jgi:hypothetical protein